MSVPCHHAGSVQSWAVFSIAPICAAGLTLCELCKTGLQPGDDLRPSEWFCRGCLLALSQGKSFASVQAELFLVKGFIVILFTQLSHHKTGMLTSTAS